VYLINSINILGITAKLEFALLLTSLLLVVCWGNLITELSPYHMRPNKYLLYLYNVYLQKIW